jgi:hypothetical protein
MAGSGSLEKRGPNTWRLVVSCGMKGGKQIKKKKTITVKVACEQNNCRGCTKINSCRARKEANKLLTEFSLVIEKGLLIESGKLTFADFVERWIRDYAGSIYEGTKNKIIRKTTFSAAISCEPASSI